MEALRNLIKNIPDWQTRLDELSREVDKRQAELAAVAAEEERNGDGTVKARSLRNKGSTESLKPKDDGPSFIAGPEPESSATNGVDGDVTPEKLAAQSNGCSPPRKQSRDYPPPSHPRLRSQAKRRQRSSSVLSIEEINTTYRTRSMIIVYYDSHVQSFFDELVRFISSSRNLMRKAKMAAKVAQIKKMAEADLPGGADDKDELDALPSLRFLSARRLGSSAYRPGMEAKDQTPDIYDNLDKGLDFVQGTCEHGAHQFLRDADCHDEIKKIRKRLGEVLDAARNEMERIEREEPEKANEMEDWGKVRLHRPISMRRELSHPGQEGLMQMKDQMAKLEAAIPEADAPLVADPDHIEADVSPNDEGIDMEAELSKINFRSSRNMRALR